MDEGPASGRDPRHTHTEWLFEGETCEREAPVAGVKLPLSSRVARCRCRFLVRGPRDHDERRSGDDVAQRADRSGPSDRGVRPS